MEHPCVCGKALRKDRSEIQAEIVHSLNDPRRGAEVTDSDARVRYQAQVIAPRRRILAIRRRAQQQGLIDANADLEVAITLATGAWYARALAGLAPPPIWHCPGRRPGPARRRRRHPSRHLVKPGNTVPT